MEQFTRFELLVGDNVNVIKNKTVLIIGLGGVGGYAVESLARSGIEHIILVDNDVIDITNINRQIISTLDNVGSYKTEEWKKRINLINPSCKVDIINDFITHSNITILFNQKIDYIVDACDTIETKKEIIRQCLKRNIKLISSMGTGNKMDSSKLKIVDIRKTSYDPIAKKIRKMVKDEKINKKIMVVCSDEISYTKINKTIPSNSFVPATAGLLCTNYIINDILKDSVL